MTQLDASELKARIDAREVARALGVRIASERGHAWSVHCPNAAGHSNGDRNPSASVYRDGWTCHGCGDGGDVFGLAATVYGLDVRRDFPRVLEIVAEIDGSAVIEPPPKRATTNGGRQALGFDAAKRAEVIAAIWSEVEHAPPSDALVSWLRSRGIREEIAHRYGVRDPDTARAGVVAVLDHYCGTDEKIKAAGLMGKSGLWFPLRKFLDADHALRGCLFPAIDPGRSLSFRWRYFRPPVWGSPPKPKKAMAMPNGGGPVLVFDDQAAHQVVFIAEGETDYLSVWDCIHELGADLDVGCIGLGAVSSPWRPEWAYLVNKAERVVVLADLGSTGKDGRPVAERVAAQIAKSIALDAGCSASELVGTTPEARVVCLPFPDKNDAADHHKRGELAGIINRWIQ